MNREYVCINGNVVVRDEMGEQRPVEYSDNLEEILIQENVIESLENRLRVLNCSSKKFKQYKITDSIPFLLVMLGAFALIIPFSLLHRVYSLDKVLSGTILKFMAGMSLGGLLILGISAIITTFNHFKIQKKQKANEVELEFVKKRLNLEKDKLKELKKEKTHEKEMPGFKVSRVNDLEELKQMRGYLNLFYNLGMKEKKYYKYYQRGHLAKKLIKNYSEEEINAVFDYFEEKDKALVKKR